MNFDNIDFNQKLNVLVITDLNDNVDQDFNSIITLSILEVLEYLNDLANISFLKFDNKILTATSKGQLLCMKILNDSITWFHLNQLLNMRKYYSEI
tara:strand:- start:139 stop:426 length:288 start_codon:yes stop_codon:yes gene_type:complete